MLKHSLSVLSEQSTDCVVILSKDQSVNILIDQIDNALSDVFKTDEFKQLESLNQELEKYKIYPIHKYVFQKNEKLKTALSESNAFIVYEDNNEKHLQAFLDYFYDGKLSITADNAIELLCLSQQFEMDDLIKETKKFLLENVNKETVLPLIKKCANLEKIMLNEQISLLEICELVLAENFKQIAKDPKVFLDIPLDTLMIILSFKKLRSFSNEIYEIVMQYIKSLKENEKIAMILNALETVPKEKASTLLSMAREYGAEKLCNFILAQYLDEKMDLSFLDEKQLFKVLTHPNLNISSEFSLYNLIKKNLSVLKNITKEELLQLQKSIMFEWMNEEELNIVLKDGIIPKEIVLECMSKIFSGENASLPRPAYCKTGLVLLPKPVDIKRVGVVLQKGTIARTIPVELTVVSESTPKEYKPYADVPSGPWTTYAGSPFTTDKQLNKYQCLYKAQELQKLGIATITGIKVAVTTAPSCSLNNVTIGVGTTKQSSLTTWVNTKTYYGPATVIPQSISKEFKFVSPFNWDMDSNVVFEICWTSSSTPASGNSKRFIQNGGALRGYGVTSSPNTLTCTQSNEVVLLVLMGTAQKQHLKFPVPKGFTPAVLIDGTKSSIIKQEDLQIIN